MSSPLVKHGARVAALILVLALPGRVTTGQGSDPLAGTWILDVFKSTYYVGEPPIRRTLTIEAVDGGIKQTSETTRQGFNISETTRVEFTAKFDGKDYPVTNSVATVSLKRVDPATVERIGKIEGKTSEAGTMKLSNGNRTLTVTTRDSTDASAETLRVEVFNKK
jgi:hypothetical protein